MGSQTSYFDLPGPRMATLGTTYEITANSRVATLPHGPKMDFIQILARGGSNNIQRWRPEPDRTPTVNFGPFWSHWTYEKRNGVNMSLVDENFPFSGVPMEYPPPRAEENGYFPLPWWRAGADPQGGRELTFSHGSRGQFSSFAPGSNPLPDPPIGGTLLLFFSVFCPLSGLLGLKIGHFFFAKWSWAR